MTVPAKPWKELSPEEKRALVEPLHREGLTLAKICQKLGAPSRSAISGVVNRFYHRNYTSKKPLPAIVDDALPDWKSLSAREKDEIIKQLRREGIGTRATARKFSNCSESAVNEIVGRLRRRGELEPIKTVPKVAKPKKVAAKPKKPSPKRFPSARLVGLQERRPVHQLNFKERAKKRAEAPGFVAITCAGAWDPIPGVEPVAIADLENHHCRWPLEVDGAEIGFFCGAPRVEGCSYCSSHQSLSVSVYQPTRKVA